MGKPRKGDISHGKTRGQSRTEEMMGVALGLFARQGVSAVTIVDIAQAMGVNTALIYYYFDSKEDLFHACLRHCIERTVGSFGRLEGMHDEPVKMITAWFQTNARMHVEIRQLVKVMLDYSTQGARTDASDAQVRDFYQQEGRILSDSIRQGIGQNVFAPVNVRQAALFVSTHLDGIMLRSMIQSDMDVAAAIRVLQRIFFEHLGYRRERRTLRSPASPVASRGTAGATALRSRQVNRNAAEGVVSSAIRSR